MKTFKQITKGKKYKTLSPLERNIVDQLLEYSIEFDANYKVGPYFIDIAFPKYKVGLEIDGYAYHRGASVAKQAKDELREDYLREVKGWKIERVPGWFCYAEPEASIAKVLRNIPDYATHPKYIDGCQRMKQWYARDLLSRGLKEQAFRVLGQKASRNA